MMARKAELAAPVVLAADNSLESLATKFQDFIAGIYQQTETPPGPEQQAAIKAAAVTQAKSIVLAVEQRDELAAFIFALEDRAERIRKTVRAAEELARHYEASARFLKSSIEMALIELNLKRVEGMIHRFAIYNQPSQLVISNETLIPEEFFDSRQVTERKLNKERLLSALQEGKEVPGASLETQRTRLDIK